MTKEEVQPFNALLCYDEAKGGIIMGLENEKRGVSIGRKDAEAYLKHEAVWAPAVARGVSLCILSPALLILLSGLSAEGILPISELLAGGIGTVVLLITVAAAVTLFIRYSMEAHGFEFIQDDRFELEGGVENAIREKKMLVLGECTKKITSGVVICILASVPLLAAAFTEKILLLIFSLVFLLCAVAAGVNLLVRAGIVWDSYSKLLRDGDYSRRLHGSLTDKIGSFYWPLVTAVYLLWSFISGKWELTWIVWPAAALIFAAIAAICRLQRRT